jgi:hypothetical protein
MRFLRLYLAVYFALIIGAMIALWWGGVLAHLSPLSILLGLTVAVGLGALLALVWTWRPGRVPR